MANSSDSKSPNGVAKMIGLSSASKCKMIDISSHTGNVKAKQVGKKKNKRQRLRCKRKLEKLTKQQRTTTIDSISTVPGVKLKMHKRKKNKLSGPDSELRDKIISQAKKSGKKLKIKNKVTSAITSKGKKNAEKKLSVTNAGQTKGAVLNDAESNTINQKSLGNGTLVQNPAIGSAQTNRSADKRQLMGSSNQRTASRKQKEAPEPSHIEVDSNWKELAKKLGLDPNKRKGQAEDEERITEESVQTKKRKIWFDDVDEMLVAESVEHSGDAQPGNSLVKEMAHKGLTKCLAMDCEMVGIGPGGNESALARISIVNQFGHCVYDKFVKPKEEVTDYRTWVSGVRPEDLETAEEFEVVQKEVAEMVKGRILVGHSIKNDEKVLFLNHPKKFIRDTQQYVPFRNLFGGRKPALKKLCERVLKVDIQKGEHSSVQDAQATMRLYTLVRKRWEKYRKQKYLLTKYRRKKALDQAAAKRKADGE